jgi:hypothetical protein
MATVRSIFTAPSPRYQRTASGRYKSEIVHPLNREGRLCLTADTLHDLEEDRRVIRAWQLEFRRDRLTLDEFRAKLARYEHPKIHAVRFRGAWDEHVELARASMRAKLRSIWIHQLAPKLGELALIDLRARRLDAWDRWCIDAGYAPNTQWDAWTQSVACVRRQLTEGDDFPWRLPGARYWHPSRRRQALTSPAACTSLEEGQQLIAAALAYDREERARERFADLLERVIVAIRNALRNGEIAGLAWDDLAIDGGRPRMRVQRQAIDQWRTHSAASIAEGRPAELPKGGKPREILLDLESVLALHAQREQLVARGWYRDDGPVFPGHVGEWEGTWRNNANGIDPREFRRVAARAGLPFTALWVPHSLRHSTATLEALSGANLRAIQKRTGHGSLEVLEGYISKRLGSGESAIGRLLPEGSEEP